MRTKIAALALATGLAVPTIAMSVPAFAADSATPTATTSAAARATARLTQLKDALKGLVTDGTLTQAQADKVATTLSTALPDGGRGHGPRAGHLSPEATAKVLGITVDELQTAREAGKTLAQIASAKGMSKADLISGLVTAAKAQLAADVKAGTITQAQADEASSTLTQRVTDSVDRTRPVRGDHDGDGSAPAPAASPSASATA